MAANVPSHSIVPYQTPNARALQAAGHAAMGFLAAVGIVVIPIITKFLTDANFSKTGVTTLATLLGTAVLGVLLTYATKYAQAKGSDVAPTVTPTA